MANGKKVYVAGPYTKGDQAVNVRTAIMAANRLMDEGHHPYTPHLTHFHHLLFPRRYEDWMELDFAFLRHCDALLRLPGESSGADREVALADKLGIPVFTSHHMLVHYLSKPDEAIGRDTRVR